MIGIEFAHHAQFSVAWRLGFRQLVCYAQSPAGIGEHFFDPDTGMHGRKKGLAIMAEAQHTERGDDRRRSRRWRQALRATPTFASAKSGRCDMSDAVAQARAIVSEQHYRTAREASDVASTARTRQALHFFIAMAPGGIKIAETIYFGGAEKAYVHSALLKEAHYVQHRAALRGAAQIWWIAHGVEKFAGGSFAQHAIFKEADGAWGVRATRHEKGEHRQTHADEYQLAIGDFTRGGGYHQFAESVAASGEIGFGASHQDCAL
jgi:hypothetical protein